MPKSKPEIFIWDIEVYPNMFCFVFKPPGGNSRSHITFTCFDHPKKVIDDRVELYRFLTQDNLWLVGYNSIQYDSQVAQFFLENKANVTPAQMKDFSDLIFKKNNNKEKPVYWQSEIAINHLDLFKIWSYNNPARMTSLKWLEYSMRSAMIKDLPQDVNKDVSPSTVSKVVSYCKYDVDRTEDLWDRSVDMMEVRKKLRNKYDDDKFLNLGDTNVGAHIFLKEMASMLDVDEDELKKKRTYRERIVVKDNLVPYLNFESFEMNGALDFFKETKLFADEEGKIQLKGVIDYSFDFGGLEYVMGAGGLHASMHNANIIVRGDMECRDIDVKSYYPNLSIYNKFYPAQLSKKFCDVYLDLYNTRKKYPKSNPLNTAYKLSLNSAYGKSNSVFSFLYDPQFTIQITINGQLSLLMLAEKLYYEGCHIVQVNTDGMTVIYDKKNRDIVTQICKEWEEQTKLELEDTFYTQMVIRDVNNYLAIFDDGSVKRKGAYCIYDDYVSGSLWHKNPSGTVIPKAVNNFYVNHDPIEKTIDEEQNIYEFCYGFKKKRNFDFLIMTPNPDTGYVEVEKNEDRVLRYYVSKGGSSLYKLYKDNRVLTLGKDRTFTTLQTVRKKDTYPDLDREWYKQEAFDMVDQMNEIIYE